MGRRTRSSPSGGELRTWRRGPVSQQRTSMEDQEVASVNTGDPEAALYQAERRVLKIQTKLYQWACADPGRRFDDLFNLEAYSQDRILQICGRSAFAPSDLV